MFGKSFGRQRVGHGISARTINQPTDAAGRFSRLRVGTGMAQTWMAGIPFFRRSAGPTILWARIAGAPTSGKYPWRGIYPTAGGTWADLPASVSGTTSANPAYEANSVSSVPVGTRVILRRGYAGDWRFQMVHC